VPAFGFGRRRDCFDLLQSRRGASPRPASAYPARAWYGGRVAVMRCPIYSPFPSTLLGDRSGLRPARRPTMPSADFCTAVRALTTSSVRRTQCRSLGVSPTAFIAHPPDLQFWPLMDMDFATSCPLVRPALPPIRFLFSGRDFCSTLPSDGPSRFRPLRFASASPPSGCTGDFHPQTADMSDTQDAARRLRRWPPPAGGILDCRCARRSAGRQVGTKGWSFPIEQRDAALLTE